MGSNSNENNIPIKENNPEPLNKTETPEPAPAPPPQAGDSASSNTKKPGSRIKKRIEDLNKQLNDDAIKRKKKEVDDLKNDPNPLRSQQARFELLMLEFGALVNEHYNLTEKLLDSWDNRYNYNGEETSGMKARRELLANSKTSAPLNNADNIPIEMKEMPSPDLNKSNDMNSENAEKNYGDIFKDPNAQSSENEQNINSYAQKPSGTKQPIFVDSRDENNEITTTNSNLDKLLNTSPKDRNIGDGKQTKQGALSNDPQTSNIAKASGVKLTPLNSTGIKIADTPLAEPKNHDSNKPEAPNDDPNETHIQPS